MSEQITVTLHEIATDGLPKMDELTGRVAFIFDGCIVSGWPLSARDPDFGRLWEGDSDVANHRPKANVTHWVEFERPIWELGKGKREL